MSDKDPDHPQAMPHDYWENVDGYADSPRSPSPAPGVEYEDLDESVVEHVENRTDEMWNIQSIILADRDDSDGSMYLLVIRSGVGDEGNLLLDERYFFCDPSDPWRDETGYSGNGIMRQVSGEGMLLGLKVAYAATSDGLAEGHSLVMEAQNGKLQHNSDALTETFADLLGVDEPEPGPDIPEGHVECMRCSREMDPESEEAIAMSGDLGDIWIHNPDTGGCPDEGGESDE